MQDEMDDYIIPYYTDPEDWVKVVRCKNCKYGKSGEMKKVIICGFYRDKHLKLPDDYCSEPLKKSKEYQEVKDYCENDIVATEAAWKEMADPS